jgi:hydroxymethylbilane synthase
VKEIVIGTRGSQLALWQAEFIKAKLEKISEAPVRLNIIKTSGDKIDHLSFDKMEGKGFFTKEIEDALLNEQVDLAVHSLKDLMTTMPEGLILGAAGFREDSREAILIRRESYQPDAPLKVKNGGVIGSSSVRRQCQIAEMSPDLRMKDLRGNVPTRIDRLREGQYDAIVLAYAGIRRLKLDLSDLEVNLVEIEDFLPAPGQGILGMQTRADDNRINEIVSQLDDKTARTQAQLERGLLARFDGGCQLPLGVYSKITGDEMSLHAVLGCSDEKGWTGLARASASGKNIDSIVEETYKKLTEQCGT